MIPLTCSLKSSALFLKNVHTKFEIVPAIGFFFSERLKSPTYLAIIFGDLWLYRSLVQTINIKWSGCLLKDGLKGQELLLHTISSCRGFYLFCVQLNLSIADTIGPKSVFYKKVSIGRSWEKSHKCFKWCF